MNKPTVTVQINDEPITLKMHVDGYVNSNGKIAIYFTENGYKYGTLTVNMPDIFLQYNEILIRTYADHTWAGIVASAMPEYFTDTGHRFVAGNAEVELWKFHPPENEPEEWIGLDLNMRPEDTLPG